MEKHYDMVMKHSQ